MRGNFLKVLLAVASFGSLSSCKTASDSYDSDGSGVSNAGYVPHHQGQTLNLFGSGKQTTHYCSSTAALPPSKHQWLNPTMGPGHFHCKHMNSQFNDSRKETALYIAISDQVKEIFRCKGWECFPNDKYCGAKVKVSCNPSKGDQNCNPNAQPLIVTVTDFCPIEHPDRKPGQTPPFCGDGQTVVDISDWVWAHFRANDNNLKLTFEPVSGF